MQFVGNAELCERNRMSAEGIGLNHIRARRIILAVDFCDPFRTREQHVFRAVLKRRTTPVINRGVILLNHGAHRSVEYDDTCG